MRMVIPIPVEMRECGRMARAPPRDSELKPLDEQYATAINVRPSIHWREPRHLSIHLTHHQPFHAAVAVLLITRGVAMQIRAEEEGDRSPPRKKFLQDKTLWRSPPRADGLL